MAGLAFLAYYSPVSNIDLRLCNGRILDRSDELLPKQNPFILPTTTVQGKHWRDYCIHVWIEEERNRNTRFRRVVYDAVLRRYVGSVRPFRQHVAEVYKVTTLIC